MVERERRAPRATGTDQGGYRIQIQPGHPDYKITEREEEKESTIRRHTQQNPGRRRGNESMGGGEVERSVEGGGRNTSKAEYKRNRDPHQEGE